MAASCHVKGGGGGGAKGDMTAVMSNIIEKRYLESIIYRYNII